MSVTPGLLDVSVLPILAIPIWFAALILCVMIHELGHLAAGRIVGFEFRHILAGAFMLSKEAGGYQFRFLPRLILSGGRTAMVPLGLENLRRRFYWFVAGGPVATAFLFLPITLLPHGTTRGCFLLANAIVACLSWIPLVVKGSPTDAKAIQILAGRGPSSERLAAVLYLIAMDAQGVEPGAWPAELVEKLKLAPRDRAFHSVGLMFLHLYARDRSGPDEVAVALENVLAAIVDVRPELRCAYFGEAAFFQGVYRRDASLARAWLEDARKVKNVVRQADWDAHSLAAIALAEGNHTEARDLLTRAIAHLDRRPPGSGSIASERARLVELLNERARIQEA